MSADILLRCGCGELRGALSHPSPSAGFHFVCYCADCQAFARFLGRGAALDAAGGTTLVQVAAGRVTLASGADALRCLTLSGKVLRWYAGCCRTPIANTAVSARFPLVALMDSVLSEASPGGARDSLLGPPLCRIFERSATAPLPPDAPPPLSLGVSLRRAALIFGWWLRGLGQPNPFFEEATGRPRSVPQRLTPEERTAAYAGLSSVRHHPSPR